MRGQHMPAGSPDPERDDAPNRGNGRGAKGQGNTADSTDAAFAKLVATAKARAALAGFELVDLPDGSFVITRWNLLSRELPHLAAVDAFLQRAGATP